MKTARVSNRTAGNRPGWKHYIRRLQGSTVRFDLSSYASPLAAISELESACRELSDREILDRSRVLQERARAGEPRSALRPSLYALAREASRRVLGQRPFDEQLIAALALDDGNVVEMQTGEGKTLTAVMPAALNGLAGRGAHVLTFNDYLARRDAEWMGPVYRLLGLSVGYVQQGMTPRARRAAYGADVTYVTAKEAGFDHLRDLLVMDAADLGAPAVPLRARRRGGLAADRRGARAAGDRRQRRSRRGADAAARRARRRRSLRACTSTPTSTDGTSS